MGNAYMNLFTSSLDKSAAWLKRIDQELGWNDPQKSYQALRAVLHLVRDRVGLNEAVQFGAQLPLLISGIYYDGWKPAGRASKLRSREAMVEYFTHDFQAGAAERDPESIIRTVFSVIGSEVTRGELDDVISNVPEEARDLFPVHAATHG